MSSMQSTTSDSSPLCVFAYYTDGGGMPFYSIVVLYSQVGDTSDELTGRGAVINYHCPYRASVHIGPLFI